MNSIIIGQTNADFKQNQLNDIEIKRPTSYCCLTKVPNVHGLGLGSNLFVKRDNSDWDASPLYLTRVTYVTVKVCLNCARLLNIHISFIKWQKIYGSNYQASFEFRWFYELIESWSLQIYSTLMYCSNLQRNEPPLKSICTFSTISCPTITKPTRRSARIN